MIITLRVGLQFSYCNHNWCLVLRKLPPSCMFYITRFLLSYENDNCDGTYSIL